MVRRKGLGKGRGKGYENLLPTDPRIHSQSAKGMKQPQKVAERYSRIEPEPADYTIEVQFAEEYGEEILSQIKEKTGSEISAIEEGRGIEGNGIGLLMEDGTEWLFFETYRDAEDEAKADLIDLWDSDPETMGENLKRDFITATELDKDMLATDEAESRTVDLDDDELVRQGNNYNIDEMDEWEEAEERIDELEEKEDTDDLTDDESEELVRLRDNDANRLEDIREGLREYIEREVRQELDQDLLGYFEEQGFDVSNINELPIVQIDYEGAAQFVVDNDGLSTLARYDGDWEELRPDGVLIRVD